MVTLDAHDRQKNASSVVGYNRGTLLLVLILLIASILRLYHLGQASLWYDEVVTMRLARTAKPGALIGLLRQIDATRAPLHPLLLQQWLALFGSSDTSGRSFSVVCGVVTVGLVYWVGLQAFDMTTGLWASWLCAVSPLMVYYSREARMYMWLVLVTCLAWGLLLSHARRPCVGRLVFYGLSLVAVVYSHPLGLLMVGALGLASVLFRQEFGMSWRGWLYTQLAVVLAVAYWVRQYLDHPPESTTGLLPIRYLLGMPIGFIGGNFKVLVICSVLVAYGLVEIHRRGLGSIPIGLKCSAVSISLLIWVLAPPLLLYIYARIAQPIFGPARYTLFVGPAYLVLVARGLGKLPGVVGLMTAIAGAMLSGSMLLGDVYRPDLKADWKGLAAYVNQRGSDGVVAIISVDPLGSTDLETARYYFGPDRVVLPWSPRVVKLPPGQRPSWVSIPVDDGRPMCELPTPLMSDKVIRESVEFRRLRLMRVDFEQGTTLGE